MSDVETVSRLFPDRERDVRRLAEHSEPFRDLCTDLAEVARVLGELSANPAKAMEAQQYRDLLDALVAEAGHWLAAAAASPATGLPTRA